MRKTLREHLIDYASKKPTVRRAQNRSKFSALWPEINSLINEGWSLKDINEVAKAHGLLDLHYDSFRRYVNQKRRLEKCNSVEVAPEKKKVLQQITVTRSTSPERKEEHRSNVEKPLSYSVPPKFTGGRGDDEEDITTFLLGKGYK